MAWYPEVLGESETLAFAEAGGSLSRFGDGELRLAVGGDAISQREKFPDLRAELVAILRDPAPPNCLVCIPNAKATRNADSWARYTEDRFITLYRQPRYGSAFITRPDNALERIDTDDYWARVRSLWAGKSVVLVSGGHNGLKPRDLAGAKSVRFIEAPEKNAYSAINKLREQIGRPEGPVLLCVGVTATCLAYRLAQDGHQGLDLGHIGMFMRHAGSYRYAADDLATPKYRRLLEKTHAQAIWGDDGAKHVEAVRAILAAYPDVTTILDYGCGRGELARALDPIRVAQYDPGIPERSKLPKPADLVVCTDVMEHVEPDLVPTVIQHIGAVTGRLLYLVVSLRPANRVLPDGRNAHLTILTARQWEARFQAAGFLVMERAERPGHELKAFLRRVR